VYIDLDVLFLKENLLAPEPADPAHHWLTRHKRLGDDNALHPLPIEEGVELELSDLKADPGFKDELDPYHAPVKLTQTQVSTVASTLEEFAARTRHQVDSGAVAPTGRRLAELADILIRDLRLAAARADLP
jgi:hypothetical protein